MLKRIMGIFVPLLIFTNLLAQPNPDIYRVMYLKPKSGNTSQLLSGIKEHNKKHHNKGVMKVRTYRVVSGEKSGWLVRTYGPMKWSQVDEFVANNECNFSIIANRFAKIKF